MSLAPRAADQARHLADLRAAALQAVDPAAAVRAHLAPADLAEAERVFIVGAGKAGAAMARAAVELCAGRLAGGVMAVPHLPAEPPAGVAFLRGGHPLPEAGSLAAGRAIADLLAQTTARDLVLALISGGGSALLELLKPGLTLDDLQTLNTRLLRSGAPIQTVNAVRRQLSLIKGGGLARLAGPARVLGLIMSDIIGNPLELIASGPTVAPAAGLDPALITPYGLEAGLAPAVRACLAEPPPPAAASPRVENRLIASNRQAGQAARDRARALGFTPVDAGDDWQGEARATAGRFVETLLIAARANPRPICLVAGGETTVTVRGAGRGGRNQEAALAAALALAAQGAGPETVVATFATDGVDGPTDAAGAVATGATLARARALGLDAAGRLADNDAYGFFAPLGDLIQTGPTGTNVNDLWFGLAY